MHCVTKNPVSLLHWEFSYKREWDSLVIVKMMLKVAVLVLRMKLVTNGK